MTARTPDFGRFDAVVAARLDAWTRELIEFLAAARITGGFLDAFARLPEVPPVE